MRVFHKAIISRSQTNHGRKLNWRSQTIRYHQGFSRSVYKDYLNHSVEDIVTLDEELDSKIVNTINEIPITVDEVKRVYTHGTLLNDTAVGALLLQIGLNSACKPAVLHSLTIDLTRFDLDNTFERYQHEYMKLVEGKSMIIVPINEGNHYTLIVVRTDTKDIEYYNSFWRGNLGVSKKFKTVKLFIEKLLSVNLTTRVITDLPSQYDKTSCGIYTVLFGQHVLDGLDLSGITDEQIPAIRYQLASKLLQRPSSTLLMDHRSVKNETDDTFTGDAGEVEDNNTDYTYVQDKYLPIVPMIASLNINKEEDKPEYPSYETSIQLAKELNTPFRGYDLSGRLVTFNAQGDWRRMLSVTEIVNHLSPSNPKEGREMLREKILSEPDVALGWVSLYKDPKTVSQNSMFNFCFNTFGNFKIVKQTLVSQGYYVNDHRIGGSMRKPKKPKRLSPV